jgi:hypothetical protein
VSSLKISTITKLNASGDSWHLFEFYLNYKIRHFNMTTKLWEWQNRKTLWRKASNTERDEYGNNNDGENKCLAHDKHTVSLYESNHMKTYNSQTQGRMKTITLSLSISIPHSKIISLIVLLQFDSQWCHWNFSCHNPSGRTMALGSTQPLRETRTRNTSCGVKAVSV